jgi:hypothetical protein
MNYTVYVMQANYTANMSQLVWSLCTVKGSVLLVQSNQATRWITAASG